MSDESRIRDLLEEALNSGRTPEDVCVESPELLWEVRERLKRCMEVEAQIDAIFPSSGISNQPRRPLHLPTALPQIPGYQVEAILGHGGMGVVYKARHLKLKRSVAIKMVLSGVLAAPEEMTGLAREAEAVAGLRHPNIVQVHDVGDFDGLPYFTMEFVEGGSLAQKLDGVPQPAREAAAMAATLAGAIHAAHLGGIVHRDLKPSNILITADGVAKITDFGLARQGAGDATLTLRAAKVGTPSYMAPEQALGTASSFCPSVDIYSLGAILYEMLTGRPPFRAETASETQRQLVAEEPVPPSRLNAKVPRDLETICLKCLRKEPEKRYLTAEAVAQDLDRFLRGEPIRARPVGWLERGSKWARRRPGLTTALASSVFLAILLVAGALQVAADRARRRQAIDADLKEVVDLQRRAQWPEARATLDRAEARLEGGDAGDLRHRLTQARLDLDLVIRLDRIHVHRLADGELPFYKARAARAYSAAFAAAGLGKLGDDPAGSAARVSSSAVGGALLAALDDWSVCASDDAERRWVLRVAKAADPDASGWRERIRDPGGWDDRNRLTELAAGVPVSTQPVPLLLAIGERLRNAGKDAPAFLKQVQKEHPADFWANLTLGDALVATAPVEAAGYYRAALASRPGEAVGYTSVGDALNGQNLGTEAIGYYRRAVQVDPRYPRGHTNLGNILNAAGRTEEAIACYRAALEVDPNYAWAHFDLANTLRAAGREEEALRHYRRFNELEPTNTHVANVLRADLVARGRGEEVCRAWKKSLEADPPGHDAWFGYAELCLYLGRVDEYQWARRALLRHFGDTTDPFVAERTSRALSLFPLAEQGELRAAAALAERAVAAKGTTPQWIYPYFLFSQGLAEYREDRFDDAIALMKGDAASVMGPAPRLVIAMAQYRSGRRDEARKTLAAEMTGFDWSPAQANSRDHWIWHVLRREAEALIVPDLPAFLRGDYEPRDKDERLVLLGTCRARNLTRAAARLYAAAFAADPRLAEDSRSGLRYKAACAAASAGCGVGADVAGMDEVERAAMRKEALAWLREELSKNASPADGRQKCATLKRWQTEPELAGLREADALAKLPAPERADCTAFWEQVATALEVKGSAGR